MEQKMFDKKLVKLLDDMKTPLEMMIRQYEKIDILKERLEAIGEEMETKNKTK